VSTDTATWLAGLALGLLRHSDQHTGRPATVRIAEVEGRLHLWLSDPECSPECLHGSGQLPPLTGDGDGSDGMDRLVLQGAGGSGLRLHWIRTQAGHPTPPAARRVLAAHS